MPEKYNPKLENAKEKHAENSFEDELDRKLEKEEELEKKYGKPTPREQRKEKAKYAPRGGTMAAQVKRTKERRFYLRSKWKPKIKIIDKTKK